MKFPDEPFYVLMYSVIGSSIFYYASGIQRALRVPVARASFRTRVFATSFPLAAVFFRILHDYSRLDTGLSAIIALTLAAAYVGFMVSSALRQAVFVTAATSGLRKVALAVPLALLIGYSPIVLLDLDFPNYKAFVGVVLSAAAFTGTLYAGLYSHTLWVTCEGLALSASIASAPSAISADTAEDSADRLLIPRTGLGILLLAVLWLAYFVVCVLRPRCKEERWRREVEEASDAVARYDENVPLVLRPNPLAPDDAAAEAEAAVAT